MLRRATKGSFISIVSFIRPSCPAPRSLQVVTQELYGVTSYRGLRGSERGRITRRLKRSHCRKESKICLTRKVMNLFRSTSRSFKNKNKKSLDIRFVYICLFTRQKPPRGIFSLNALNCIHCNLICDSLKRCPVAFSCKYQSCVYIHGFFTNCKVCILEA